MSVLIERIGEDLWEVVLDLLTFEHECCYNCMPWDGGECVWITERYDLVDVLPELIEFVCKANGVEVPGLEYRICKRRS